MEPIISDEDLRSRLRFRDMVRERTLSLYEQLLGLDFRERVLSTLEKNGKFVWYDMCCGNFEAGIGLKDLFYCDGRKDILPKITAVGIDIDTRVKGDEVLDYGVIRRMGNVVEAVLPPDVDLITCLRGLRYVEEYLGKACQAVEHWYNSMPVGATLAFDYNPEIFFEVRGDGPILINDAPLLEVLKLQLGESVEFGKFKSLVEAAFTVKIHKCEDKKLKLH